MTRFEEIGRDRIVLARTPEYAKASLERSCFTCCARNMSIDCDQCAINSAYKAKIGYFKSQGLVKAGNPSRSRATA